MQDAWFNDQEAVRKESGLNPDKSLIFTPEKYCLVCYTEGESFDEMKCGHSFCSECWRSYLKEKVTIGHLCLDVTCMQEGCPLTLPHSKWTKILENDEDELAAYRKFHCKSFTDDNKSVRWCPKPGCIYAVESTNYARTEIECTCGHVYCF